MEVVTVGNADGYALLFMVRVYDEDRDPAYAILLAAQRLLEQARSRFDVIAAPLESREALNEAMRLIESIVAEPEEESHG